MSSICGQICSIILKENFGPTVEAVGMDMFKSGQIPIRLIQANSNVSRETVRLSLCCLIKYGLVSFSPSAMPHAAEYRLLVEETLSFIRYPRYLMLTKKLYGNETEALVEEIIRLGSAPLSQIVGRAYKRLQGDETDIKPDSDLIIRLKDQFNVLVNRQYFERCPTAVVADQPVPDLKSDPVTRFSPIKVDHSNLINLVFSGSWDHSDPVVWNLNHGRFQQDMRDELLVSAMSRRISPAAGEVLRMLLRQAYLVTPPNAPVSNPITVSQLRDHCRKAKLDVKHLDDNLIVMGEDPSGFVSRDNLSSNGAYLINMQHAIEELTWSLLANAVEVRHGGGAARIFRLTHEQEFIEQEEIQKRAMLPDKECKLLTYTLMQGGWIHQHELKKGQQKSGPSKTFYLYCIDLAMVVRMYVEICYKSLVNCASRRESENLNNSSLLVKQQRIQSLSLHMRLKGASEEDIEELAELITPPETALLEKIQATINKLHQAELEIDDSLFILQLYLESKMWSAKS